LANVGEGQPNDSGIFLTVLCSKYENYNNAYTVLTTSKKVCLANKPIITLDDFESISSLNDSNTNQIYFDVKLSSDASEILDKLNKNFPNSELALVIENQVFIVFKLNGEQLNRTFRFKGKQSEISDFITMNKKLLKLKNSADF